ncbi:hypothetical protein LCM20_03770 [Halobacillus litoralis]|uniref:hypothetical protein n=1 Tax=Halobacillus litoralis TaxID=45668 RepID=UPI001CD1E3EC|nr:hypothetical protein [Halobacillus litoralis]MCA0969711.1 hypothetical protein [Halobacillus litoralis]
MNSGFKAFFLIFFLLSGVALGILAFSFRTLILSDIPVSFSAPEGMTALLLLFSATAVLSITLLFLKTNIGFGIMTMLFSLALFFTLQVLKTDLKNDPPAIAQLQLEPVLHSAFLLLFTITLWFRNRKKA